MEWPAAPIGDAHPPSACSQSRSGGDVDVEIGRRSRSTSGCPRLAGVVEREHRARRLDAVVDLGGRDDEAVARQPEAHRSVAR